MSISYHKIVTDSLWILTPQERVRLILEYQNLRETTGKDYSYEINQVQQKMPYDQRNEYASIAFKIIIANKILLNLILHIKEKFYQEYSVLLLKIIKLLLFTKESENQYTQHIQIIQTIYQYLLSCKAIADTISQQLNCENILFPVYEKFYQLTRNDISSLLKAIDQLLPDNKKIDYSPNPQFQSQIIESINQEVSNQVEEI